MFAIAIVAVIVAGVEIEIVVASHQSFLSILDGTGQTHY